MAMHYKKNKSFLCVLFILLIISAALLPLVSQPLQAMTRNDAACAVAGGLGGTCAYDPTDTCQTDTAVTAGDGAPDGATFPDLDPDTMAVAIDAWVAKVNPSSTLKGLGSTIVATAKHSNINPFLFAVIARKESTLGDPSVVNVQRGNNAFGRTATKSQPNFSGNRLWYKWSSVKASVDYQAQENKNALGGGDMGSYFRRVYGDLIDSSDFVGIITKYAPPSENETDQYIRDIKGWLKELVDLTNDPSAATASPEVSNDAVSSSGDSACACTDPSLSGGTLSQRLGEIVDTNNGKTSVSVSTLEGKIYGDSAGNRQMPTRSSYKIYTAYATLKAIEDGNISWNSRIWGDKTVEEAMEQMIVKSNNYAAEALRTSSKVGTPSEVTKLLQDKVGLSKSTIMGNDSWRGPRGTNTQSTANDFVKFLILLQKRKLPGVSKDSSYDKLLTYMKRATTDGSSSRDGIAAGVGPGVDIADKPGWAPEGPDQASNDVGIVYRKNVYVIAVLTDSPNEWSGVAEIAKKVDQLVRSSDETGAEDPIDVSRSSANADCASFGGGDFVATVKAYAHPDYHKPPFLERKPDYAQAINKARKENNYVGGSVDGVPGIDCGGFVTRLMLDSGFEPNYNYAGKLSDGAANTFGGQEPWLKSNWKLISPTPKTTKDLEPGDVAINHDHTYVYVGKISGFNRLVASASYSEKGKGRAPMAGKEAPADPSFRWYRKN